MPNPTDVRRIKPEDHALRPGAVSDSSVRDLGHNHATKIIKPLGLCPRCDYVRGAVALGL